jgi:hypothetical protein
MPRVGDEAVAQIGDPMIWTVAVTSLPALHLETPLVHVTQYRDDLKMKLQIESGLLELAGTDGMGGRYFSAHNGLRLAYETKDGFAAPEQFRGGIYMTASGTKSLYWFWDGVSSASIVAAPAFQHTMSTLDHPTKDARFRRELIYSGVTQSSLSILYREFIDNLARPAFSQELKYDLARGATIGYKGARFEVLSAGNTSITYRVLAPIEHPE